MSQVREYSITIPNTAGAFNVDLTILHGLTVYDAWFVKTGGAGGAADTVTLSSGANAITNAMDANQPDQTVVRAGTIDDATYIVTAAQGLRATCNNGNAGVFGGVLTCIGVPTATP
ncbi:hypothetical protein CMI37_07535 [Candidatus Pacearchaeota archaeon]|jgi:hypothetical protein|nr:hypothetical protein [Candidatus Pacearchaeota archaeon]|tara:strand:- start:254 stop:601 length:348 start_codon:yes stop_codon:yes gene_type:complete